MQSHDSEWCSRKAFARLLRDIAWSLNPSDATAFLSQESKIGFHCWVEAYLSFSESYRMWKRVDSPLL